MTDMAGRRSWCA